MDPMAIMALGQLFGGIVGGFGQVQNAKFQSNQAKQNAAFREFDAKDAILRGKQKQQGVRRTAAQTKGEIELAAAAQGQSVAAGSVAGNLMAEADQLSERDVSIIKNNAMREAFGYRQQGRDIVNQANLNKSLAWGQAGQSIATGGLNAASTYLKSGALDKKTTTTDLKFGESVQLSASNFNPWGKS